MKISEGNDCRYNDYCDHDNYEASPIERPHTLTCIEQNCGDEGTVTTFGFEAEQEERELQEWRDYLASLPAADFWEVLGTIKE